MRMSIVTSMDELQEGDHLVSEEIYKAIMVLLLGWTRSNKCDHSQAKADDRICPTCGKYIG